jgi:hypothetical protein
MPVASATAQQGETDRNPLQHSILNARRTCTAGFPCPVAAGNRRHCGDRFSQPFHGTAHAQQSQPVRCPESRLSLDVLQSVVGMVAVTRLPGFRPSLRPPILLHILLPFTYGTFFSPQQQRDSVLHLPRMERMPPLARQCLFLYL